MRQDGHGATASAAPEGPEPTTARGRAEPTTARGRAEPTTARGRAKADRRAALLAAAARLFAERGFDGVSLEDLGAAVGVRGPAVYRHFPSKQAVLAALLVGASERLAAGGRTVVETTEEPGGTLRALVDFHVAFAAAEPDVIRAQDRDLHALSDEDRHAVRSLQRSYVERWVDVLARLDPDADRAELRLRAQATFGLLNSTPYSARGLPRDRVAELLHTMALAALGHPSL